MVKQNQQENVFTEGPVSPLSPREPFVPGLPWEKRKQAGS